MRKTLPGVTLQVEDAQNDVGKQLSQIQNFIAPRRRRHHRQPGRHRRDAGDDQARDGGRHPAGLRQPPAGRRRQLPEKAAFVGSNEKQSGTLEMQEVCRLLGGKGNILVMMGELSNQAARQRTQDVHDVIATPECSRHQDRSSEQTGNWNRAPRAPT